MKSIANQYRDLKEGKLSQANFMRNLRMSMPQYVTNTTSFNDAIRILKSKSILTEDLPGMASGMHGSKDFQKAMGIEDDSPYKDSAEDEFNSLLSKYDWYYEMSDDPRTYDRGIELDKKLAVLGKQIGVDKAVELFNAKAPSDRNVTSSFFMEGEDKHAKLKEILKKKVKEAIYKKAGGGGKEDLALASSPKSESELTKKGYVKVPGTEDAIGLK